MQSVLTSSGSELHSRRLEVIEQLRSHDSTHRWISVSTEVAEVDPLDVFAAAQGQLRAYWARPEEGYAFAAIGSAGLIPGSSYRHILAETNGTLLAKGPKKPIVVGGLPFDSGSSAVSSFPMMLPSVVVQNERGACHVTVTARVDRDAAMLESGIDRAEVLLASTGHNEPSGRSPISIRDLPDREAWDRVLSLVLQEIRRGALRKVVLARRQEVVFDLPPDPWSTLAHLRTQYPATSVFALDGTDGCFLGASPERLAMVDEGRFEVDCLAGSIARGVNELEDFDRVEELLRDAKNGREHAAVVEFVTDALRSASDDFRVDRASSIRTLPNVHHLCTHVTGSLNRGGGVLDLAAVLNPTAAMAGLPRTDALAFIRSHERFERGLYAGAVGWSDLDGNGDMTVGIRSAMFQDSTAFLYAGCGIVEGSEPGAEWAETEIKLLPMRSALGLS